MAVCGGIVTWWLGCCGCAMVLGGLYLGCHVKLMCPVHKRIQ